MDYTVLSHIQAPDGGAKQSETHFLKVGGRL